MPQLVTFTHPTECPNDNERNLTHCLALCGCDAGAQYSTLIVVLDTALDGDDVFVISMLMLGLVLATGGISAARLRADARTRLHLSEQIASFSLTRADCAVESDRVLVTRVLSALYNQPSLESSRANRGSLKSRTSESSEVSDFESIDGRGGSSNGGGAAPDDVACSLQLGTASFDETLRNEVAKCARRHLSSMVPSMRAFALVLTTASFSLYDNLAMLILLPEPSRWTSRAGDENNATTNQTAGGNGIGSSCVTSTVVEIRAAYGFFTSTSIFTLAWAATVGLAIACSCFPQRRSHLAESLSSLVACLLTCFAFGGLYVLNREFYYDNVQCNPARTVISSMVIVVVILAIHAVYSTYGHRWCGAQRSPREASTSEQRDHCGRPESNTRNAASRAEESSNVVVAEE
jgi:hypothetical protein